MYDPTEPTFAEKWIPFYGANSYARRNADINPEIFERNMYGIRMWHINLVGAVGTAAIVAILLFGKYSANNDVAPEQQIRPGQTIERIINE